MRRTQSHMNIYETCKVEAKFSFVFTLSLLCIRYSVYYYFFRVYHILACIRSNIQSERNNCICTYRSYYTFFLILLCICFFIIIFYITRTQQKYSQFVFVRQIVNTCFCLSSLYLFFFFREKKKNIRSK